MKKYLLFICISVCISSTFQSCKIFQPVQVISPYSQALVNATRDLAIEGDNFYATIKREEDKSFESREVDYSNMEVNANSLVAMISAMPKSNLMLIQAKSVRNLIIDRRDAHKKKGVLNDSEIEINRQNFAATIAPLLVSAQHLK